MKIIPQGSRVYLVLDEHKEKEGSIYLPEKHSERSRVATVIEVGKEVKLYEKDDRVLVSWYTGVIMNVMGMDMKADLHRMLNEDEILAKVEE